LTALATLTRRNAYPSAGARTTASVPMLVPAGTVLDDELLTKTLGEPLRDQARRDVGRAARWKSDDQMNRPDRVKIIGRPKWTISDVGGSCQAWQST
jgi:hypothetical protein